MSLPDFELVDLAPLDPAALIKLYTSVNWGSEADYQAATVREMLYASSFYTAAIADGELIGFARALSDRMMVTFLAEIVVDPQYQRMGIGSRLLDRLIQELGDTAIYATAFLGTEAFFQSKGIKMRPGKLVAVSRSPTVEVPA